MQTKVETFNKNYTRVNKHISFFEILCYNNHKNQRVLYFLGRALALGTECFLLNLFRRLAYGCPLNKYALINLGLLFKGGRKMTGNALIAQSGGPTAVFNNTISGAITRFLERNEDAKVYAGLYGIEGILKEDIVDLSAQPKGFFEGLRFTPGAGLLSCRYKVQPEDHARLIEVCKKYNIRYFFYNGGNDSMDTAYKVHLAALEAGYEMNIIGLPKTIDNDLVVTDHCPGYGSAAKYLATTVMETGMDLMSVSTKNKVTITEAMGRDAGWVTAAAALARRDLDDAPHLVYLPEAAFSMERFLEDVQKVYQRLGCVYVVVSEGINDGLGNYISDGGTKDSFGHVQLSGVGEILKTEVEKHLGVKVRCNTPGTAQRSSLHFASAVDVEEAYAVGRAGCDFALDGLSGVMVTLNRESSAPYICKIGYAPLSEIANAVKFVPKEWITPEGNFVTQEFINYARPLIMGEAPLNMKDGLPYYVKINRRMGHV